jgi:hypothetical protein
MGYAYIHSAVDADSRPAYSDVHANEQAVTAVALWRRARAFFASYGITVERVMTDNGKVLHLECLRCRAGGRRHRRRPEPSPIARGRTGRSSDTTGPCSTSGLTLGPDAARTRALDKWLHMYNYHRHHTAIGGPPVSRVKNVPGQNS